MSIAITDTDSQVYAPQPKPLVFACDSCDWIGDPLGPDCEVCPQCGRKTVFAEDADADPVNQLLAKSAVYFGCAVLAMATAIFFLAPWLAEGK